MTQGYITLAVGCDSYYELAYNLFMSYCKTNPQRLPWTIVCDRENQWTAAFDSVIILESPTFSYMDKLILFSMTPYDETIFIDADCLIFEDIGVFWEEMENVDGFSCFGAPLPLDSTEGWFLIDDIGIWKNKISFIPQMHGGICFIKKGDKLNNILNRAKEIESRYSDYKFKYFEKPADEPIMALAMAIENCCPLTAKPEFFVFLPVVSKLNLKKYISKHLCIVKQSDRNVQIKLIHFQNHYTKKAAYKVLRDVLLKNRTYSEYWYWFLYRVHDLAHPFLQRTSRLYTRTIHSLAKN